MKLPKYKQKVKMFSLASSLLGKDNPETGKNVPKIKFSDDNLQACFFLFNTNTEKNKRCN